MIMIGNYVADITITLQDGEVTELLGIECEQLDAAYDAIDWNGIEDELTNLARALVAKQGAAVRAALGNADDKTRDVCDTDSGDEPSDTPVSCRFSVVPADAEDNRHTWQYPPLDVDDISAALDEFSIDELPEWGDDLFHVDYEALLMELIDVIKRHGIVDGSAWKVIEFDGVDGRSYEDYYDTRFWNERHVGIER